MNQGQGNGNADPGVNDTIQVAVTWVVEISDTATESFLYMNKVNQAVD